MVDYFGNELSVGDKVLTYDINPHAGNNNAIYFREGIVEKIERWAGDELESNMQDWATIIFTTVRNSGFSFQTRVFRQSNIIWKL